MRGVIPPIVKPTKSSYFLRSKEVKRTKSSYFLRSKEVKPTKSSYSLPSKNAIVAEETAQEFLERSKVSKTKWTPTRPRTSLLLTSPHNKACQSDWDEAVNDPCTSDVVDMLMRKLTVHKVIRSSKPRQSGDQNRIHGLFAMDDMLPQMQSFAKSLGGGRNALSKFLHVDVHSYTSTDKDIEKIGWGRGFNIICLHDDSTQEAFCQEFRKRLDEHNCFPIWPTRVIQMEDYPNRVNSDDSNVMIEWSRSHGALSLLVEVPTIKVGPGNYKIAEDAERVVTALAETIRSFMEGV